MKRLSICPTVKFFFPKIKTHIRELKKKFDKISQNIFLFYNEFLKKELGGAKMRI